MDTTGISYPAHASQSAIVKAALPISGIVVDASCAGPDPALHAMGPRRDGGLQITVLDRWLKQMKEHAVHILCDFYELTMGNGCFRRRYADQICYSLTYFFRNARRRQAAIAAGLSRSSTISKPPLHREDIAYLGRAAGRKPHAARDDLHAILAGGHSIFPGALHRLQSPPPLRPSSIGPSAITSTTSPHTLPDGTNRIVRRRARS